MTKIRNIAECLKNLILVIPTLGLKQKGYEHEIKHYKTKQQSYNSWYMTQTNITST